MRAEDFRAAIKQHLGRWLGPPGETFHLAGNPRRGARIQKLEIPFFLPEQHIRHAVFATIGASQYRMADGGRIEALLLFAQTPERRAFEAIRALLASVATHAEVNDVVLDMGDVVPAKTMLAPLAPMDAMMLVPPVPLSSELTHLAISEDVVIDFAWFLPIFAAEADYALRHGAQTLMALFALEGVDPSDWTRAKLDTSKRIPSVEALEALIRERETARPPAPAAKAEVKGDVIQITRRGGRGRGRS